MSKRCIFCGEVLDEDNWCNNCLEFRDVDIYEDDEIVDEEYDNEYNEQEDDHSEIYDSNKEYDENSNKLRIAIRKLEDSYKFKRSLEDLEFKFNRLLENMKLDAMPTKFIEDKKCTSF